MSGFRAWVNEVIDIQGLLHVAESLGLSSEERAWLNARAALRAGKAGTSRSTEVRLALQRFMLTGARPLPPATALEHHAVLSAAARSVVYEAVLRPCVLLTERLSSWLDERKAA